MGFLYLDNSGIPRQKHSFSAGLIFDQSPSKYYYRYVLGYKERDIKASLHFGRAIEQSVQYFHDNNGAGIIEEFSRLWCQVKNIEGMTYTKKEHCWETLNRMGQEMLVLYKIRQPQLPIPLGGCSIFQREYIKEVFPNDPNYGEIIDSGRLDIVTYVDFNHPALVSTERKLEHGLLRPVIIDMKTSATNYSEQLGMAAFDRQLRRYSWLSGIRDVAFLIFIKNPFTYEKKSRVTLLADSGNYKAGTEMFVASTFEGGAWLVNGLMAIEEMDNIQGKKEGKLDTTKMAKERKQKWLENGDVAIPVKEEAFTRQRLQFNAGIVSEASAYGAGQIAARQIVQIVNSWKNNSWPSNFGIRYPTDDSNDPYFRAFELGDEVYKQEHFIMSNIEDSLFDDESEESEDNV